MLFEIFGNGHTGLFEGMDSGIQGPQSPDRQPGFHRSHDAAKQFPHLGHDHPHHVLILTYKNTADDIAVSSNEFRHRMHHDIDPHIQRFLEDRRQTRIIDVGLESSAVGNLSDGS